MHLYQPWTKCLTPALRIDPSDKPSPAGREHLSEPALPPWLAPLCRGHGYRDKLMIPSKKSHERSGDRWLIQSRVSSWQSSPSLIAASVTVEGRDSCSRYSAPNAKPDFITICQVAARLGPGSANSLSGTWFKILAAHVFYLKSLSASRCQPLLQFGVGGASHKSALKAVLLWRSPAFTDVRPDHQLSQNSKRYKSQSRLAGERPAHFIPPSVT